MAKVSTSGYKRTSKDKNEPALVIPSNNITMKGVDFPVLGTDNTGYSQMMYPGMEYVFPGNQVFEVPMKQSGGDISIPNLNPTSWLDKYQDGAQVGPRVSNLPIQEKTPTPNIPIHPVNRGYKGKLVPGASGSMTVVYEDPETGKTVQTPQEVKTQQAISTMASNNNVDPIGLGILAATGAGPLVRTAGAALPYLDAPAVLPYAGEVSWLTANNVMNAGFAANSLNQIVNPESDLRTNPNPVNVSETALGLLPFVGPGAKLATEATTVTGKYLTTQTPLKNTYKINPWAFKPNPEAYYHRSPNLENIVNSETRMLQGFGNSDAGKAYSELAIPRGGINLRKSANSQLYFSKGVPLDYGRTNMIIDKKTGKLIPGQGYKGPYMVEVEGVPMGASTKGIAPGAEPTRIGSYAVPKRPISLDEAKFYQEDWLKGYKQIETPRQIYDSGNMPISATTRNINELTGTGFREDPYYHYPAFRMKRYEISQHLNSPEGRARLQKIIDNNPHFQSLNKSVDDVIYDFNNTNFTIERPFWNPEVGAYESRTIPVDPNNAFNWYINGYDRPSFISVGQNFTPYDAEHVLEHEIAHLFQRGTELRGIDDELAKINLKSNPWSRSLWDELYSYNPFGKTADKSYSATNQLYGKDFFSWKNAKDYWKSGAGRGQEKAAFAAEIRENLLQRGLLKNRYDEITPDLLKQHYKLYNNTVGDKYRLRLYDIMKKDKTNFKVLSDVLNQLPVAVPAAIGTGATAIIAGKEIPQQKYGGWISKYEDASSKKKGGAVHKNQYINSVTLSNTSSWLDKYK